jgi:hypothetical protein
MVAIFRLGTHPHKDVVINQLVTEIRTAFWTAVRITVRIGSLVNIGVFVESAQKNRYLYRYINI